MSFLLFAGSDYKKEGGIGDLVGVFDTLDEAVSNHDPERFDCLGGWAHVFCLETKTIVKQFWGGLWCDGSENPYELWEKRRLEQLAQKEQIKPREDEVTGMPEQAVLHEMGMLED